MNKAKSYAAALFELVCESGENERIADELQIICKCISPKPEYIRMLDSALIDKRIRCEMIDSAFANAHPYIRNLMKILSERMEMHLFPVCAAEFMHLQDRLLGTADAHLVLPYEIGKAEFESLHRRLNEKTGKKLRLQVEIDPKIIGGMRLEIEGRIYDNSIRTKIRRISQMKAEE